MEPVIARRPQADEAIAERRRKTGRLLRRFAPRYDGGVGRERGFMQEPVRTGDIAVAGQGPLPQVIGVRVKTRCRNFYSDPKDPCLEATVGGRPKLIGGQSKDSL